MEKLSPLAAAGSPGAKEQSYTEYVTEDISSLIESQNKNISLLLQRLEPILDMRPTPEVVTNNANEANKDTYMRSPITRQHHALAELRGRLEVTNSRLTDLIGQIYL